MNSISVIRKIDSDDRANVRCAAERFCRRHDIAFDASDDSDAVRSIDYWIYLAHPEDKGKRRSQWARVYCRALGLGFVSVRVTEGWGHIGFSCQ